MLSSGTIMKYGAGVMCATFAFLGMAAPALADDTPAGSNLQAGGLKPPDAVQSDASPTTPTQTEAKLDLADKEDSGRGLTFAWLNAELGPQYVGLQALKHDNLVDGTMVDSKGAGMGYGAGIGARLLAFTLGARFRFGNFSDWQLWTLGAEAGMHIPLGRIEPYFTFGAGYASLGGIKPTGAASALNPSAHGLDLRGSAGLDAYLSDTFSIGANLSGDLLFLGRSPAAPTPLPPASNPEEQHAIDVYTQHGSGIGAGGMLSLVLGLHI